MSQTTNLKPEDPTVVFLRLNEKFTSNLKAQLITIRSGMEQFELKTRGVSEIGIILTEKHALTPTQKEACVIFDEIFADLTTSIYLAACALDKPAQMVLRRALELGVAGVYLWDQPHIFWGWKQCDKDLSFQEMLEHLDSESVRAFMAASNPAFTEDHLCDFSEARKLYRNLSNTVHGKLAGFESQIQDRFSVNASYWETHLDQAARVQDLLYRLWFNAFRDLKSDLKRKNPQLERFI